MKDQAPNALSRTRTDGEEKTHLSDDLPVCNVKYILVTSDERPDVHIFTECKLENDLITVKPYENFVKNGKT